MGCNIGYPTMVELLCSDGCATESNSSRLIDKNGSLIENTKVNKPKLRRSKTQESSKIGNATKVTTLMERYDGNDRSPCRTHC